MSNYRGMAVITGIDWIDVNNLRVYVTYKSFEDINVATIPSWIECNNQIFPQLIKEAIRIKVKEYYDSISENWNILTDDFILLNTPS